MKRWILPVILGFVLGALLVPLPKLKPLFAQSPSCWGTNCVITLNLTGQNNNIGTTTIYAVPASGAGMYLYSCNIVLTTAAGTSSTLPVCNFNWTDNDTNTAVGPFAITSSANSNLLGQGTSPANPVLVMPAINLRASTNLQFTTTGYASNPANAMQYAVHIKLVYLGN